MTRTSDRQKAQFPLDEFTTTIQMQGYKAGLYRPMYR